MNDERLEGQRGREDGGDAKGENPAGDHLLKTACGPEPVL